MACDIAVVGGGVVGCAVLNELTKCGLSCILCERNSDLVAEASSGNSGIVHTGFDAHPGSAEHQCLQIARQLNRKCYEKYKVPYKQTGALIVAWNQKELEKLPALVQNSHKAGVNNVFQISREQLQEKEPNLSHNALGAVSIPEEAVGDSWLFPIMMAHTAKQQGAKILLGCNVLKGSQDHNGDWLLITNTGQIKARAVVNCAGLHGDRVEKINKEPSFQLRIGIWIFPRKGQFVVFDDRAGSLLHSIILPVPTEKTKGILLFPTVYGNLVVGPTAEEQTNRDKWPINNHTSQMLASHALRLLPPLANHGVVTAYAGLRPATQYVDYQLQTHADRHWITLGGIRSTGLSAAIGLAKHVCYQVQKVLQIIPTRPIRTTDLSKQAVWSNGDSRKEFDSKWRVNVHQGLLTINGSSYRITHPLSRLGLNASVKL